MINSSSYRIYHMQIKTGHGAAGNQYNTSNLPQLVLQMAKHNWVNYFIHSAVWLLLYSFPAMIFFVMPGTATHVFFDPLNPVYLLTFMLVVIFAYLNHYWLVPALLTRKSFYLYVLCLFAFITIIIGFQYLAENAFLSAQQPSFQRAGNIFFPEIIYTFFLLIISTFSSVIMHLHSAVNAGKEEMRKMKITALNTQINPHFLFNSLNWIYLLAVEESMETPGAIIQLSDLMRYILKESGSDFIDLKKELAYIKNYLLLQKGRLGDTVSLHYSIPAYKGYCKIAPLIAMSLIENAFKHGVNPNEDSAIRIDIAIVNNRFCLQVINNRVSSPENCITGGDGIKNVQQRLNMLYPSRHELEILEDRKIYSVKLSINML